MRSRFGMMRGLAMGWACFQLGVGAGVALSQDEERSFQVFLPDSVGIRGGVAADSKAEGFRQLEAYTRWELPWHWTWRENWTLRTRGDLSLGYLTDRELDGFVGTLGPVFTVERKGVPVVFEGGSSPTLLSRHRFREGDFGMALQFTSHAGFRWHINDHVSVAYRFQHMSNAGLSDKNPGLDLHALTLSYGF